MLLDPDDRKDNGNGDDYRQLESMDGKLIGSDGQAKKSSEEAQSRTWPGGILTRDVS